jgi:superfamily I DNA and/or RNA helicase
VLKDTFLYFYNFKRADILDQTTYQRPYFLIIKIEDNFNQLSWLSYDLYNEKILDYLKECMKYDSVCYQKESAMISAIDDDELKKVKEPGYYELSLSQIAELATKIEKIGKQDKERLYKVTDLVMNILSISTQRGLFVAAYKKLLFNPEERHLILDDRLYFNYEFASDENESFKHNLKNYVDVEIDDFTALMVTNPKKAENMLIPSLKRYNETLDDRPYIMDLIRNYNGYIEKEFLSINQAKIDKTLSTPLKAFFGNMDTSLLSRKRAFHIVLLDDKMNVDQLRVVHNALKQPITYIQGPPGTGKTQSILTLLISCFFNEQTVLVSSNNNKPIDDIYTKLNQLTSKGKPIPLPILRLGNNQKIKESIDVIKYFLSHFDNYISDDTKLLSIELSNKNSMSNINEIIDHYERRLELEEEIDALESMLSHLSSELRANILIQTELNEKKKELNSLPVYQDEDIHKQVVKANESFLMWLFFTSIKYIKRLKEPKYKAFVDIILSSDEETQIRDFNTYMQNPDQLALIQRVFPIMMTTNQSAYRLGLPQPSFDLTVIDEAGQCSIGHALFPIIRGKRLLLVGDQNQLRPVITLSPEINARLIEKHKLPKHYNYVHNSIIQVMQNVDNISKFILLRYHYRCHKDIINFSNKKYYHKKLIIPDRIGFDHQALFYLNVNQQKVSRSNIRNTSPSEIESIIEDIKLKKPESVGIIAPFRNQAELIRERIADEKLSNVDVGTVHTFQGDEKDIIYLSTAITHKSSPKTFDWIKNNEELLNVATTRAKKEFVLVSDLKEIKKRSKTTNDLFELTEYVKNNGNEVLLNEIEGHKNVNSMNFRQYNTKKEKELLETINQILSLGNEYFVERQVKVADILNRFTEPILFDYGTKAVFDFVIFVKIQGNDYPKLVIELDGDEHSTDNDVKSRDQLKEKICKDNNINLIRIPNDYTRRYVFIKDSLLKLIRLS